MLCSVVISNYNYGRFLVEAIDSVLQQTHSNVEILVVDDGSSDSSLQILEKYQNERKIKVISKKNAGQLSVFNVALEHISGEVVFFLDADDFFTQDYIKTILPLYSTSPRNDFVYCQLEYFGGAKGIKRSPNITDGYSIMSAYFLRRWIGAPTSAISMRATTLQKILPIPFEDKWKIRADDCLIWGASIVGARKLFIQEPLVKYRVHSHNNFNNVRSFSISSAIERETAIGTLFEYIKKRNNMVFSTELVLLEFNSIPRKRLSDLIGYFKIALSLNLGILKSIWLIIRLFRNRKVYLETLVC